MDSVGLFKKLDNRKAVGVSSNNLGCTLLAMYKEMDGLGWLKHSGLTRREIIHKGKRLFQTAIKLGEKHYNDVKRKEGRVTLKCVDAMKTISSRYFNRALFLLTVKDDSSKPESLCESGIECLEISRTMDKEYVAHVKQVGSSSAQGLSEANLKIFLANLSRIRGHNMLLEMGQADDELMRENGWPGDFDVEELLSENFKILQTELRLESSELFRQVGIVGRIQELETELMKHNLLVGDIETAAKIAIRCLCEDTYCFADCLSMALEVMVVYANFKAEAETNYRGGQQEMEDDENNENNKVNSALYHQVKLLEKELNILVDKTRATALRSITDQVTSNLAVASTMSNPVDAPYWSSTKAAPMANWTKNHVFRVVTMEDF